MRGVYEKSEGSGVWWIRYVDSQGRLHREVAGTKSAAQKLYQLRKAAILEGRKLPAARKASVTFRQLMEAALLHSKRNKRSYVDDLAHSRRLLEAFGDIPAEAIKPEAVETFLHSHEWGPCTRNRYLATEVGLQARHRRGKLSSNPLAAVKWAKERDRKRIRSSGFSAKGKRIRCGSSFLPNICPW